jgi:hypothetical protein
MTTHDVWQTVVASAQVWRDSAVFAEFARELPRNADHRGRGLPGFLQELTAGGAQIASRPLRSASAVEMVRSQPFPTMSAPPEPALQRWLGLARQVEYAHRTTIGWIRSRVPGYPNLPVPQLVEGAPITTAEFTWRLRWPREEMKQGLQAMPQPPGVDRLLGLDRHDALRLNEAVRRVAAALAVTDEYERLRSARAGMTSIAKQQLAGVNTQLRADLRSDRVDDFEPQLALRRDQYRRERLADALAALDGPALELADAFSGVDSLIELAAADVFGQLATAGEIPTRSCGNDLSLAGGGGEDRTVTFTTADDDLWSLGEVVWIDDPLVPDAVLPTAVSVSFSQTSGVTQEITALILGNTASAWR